MTKLLKAAIAAAVLFFLACPAGVFAIQTTPPTGPHSVGVLIEKVITPEREIPVLIWYPGKARPASDTYMYPTNIEGAAMFGLPPDVDGGPYPLIVFSHGMGGCAAQHVFINENLASHGYVVVAPDHDEAAMCHMHNDPEISPAKLSAVTFFSGFNLSRVVMTLFGDMLEEREYDFSYRPAEIKAVLDRALAWNDDPDSLLQGVIDTEKIGMAGHSLGGYTALMVAGMPYICDKGVPPEDECSFEHITLDNTPNPCCLEYVREMEPGAYQDPRIDAVLVMSPAIMFPELDRAAAELDAPVMLINGDEFFEVPWEPVKTVYDNAPPPKYLVRLKKTDHMTAVDSTMAVAPARYVLPGFRDNFDEKSRAYNDYSVAFFDLYLKDDPTGFKKIEENPNSFVEVWEREE